MYRFRSGFDRFRDIDGMVRSLLCRWLPVPRPDAAPRHVVEVGTLETTPPVDAEHHSWDRDPGGHPR